MLPAITRRKSVKLLNNTVADLFVRTLAAHLGGNQAIRHGHNLNSLMLYTVALILIIAWLLGLVSSYTMGGFIHILLVVAVVVVLVRVIQGKRID